MHFWGRLENTWKDTNICSDGRNVDKSCEICIHHRLMFSPAAFIHLQNDQPETKLILTCFYTQTQHNIIN